MDPITPNPGVNGDVDADVDGDVDGDEDAQRDAPLAEAARGAAAPQAVTSGTSAASVHTPRRRTRAWHVAAVIAVVAAAGLAVAYVRLYRPRAELLDIQESCLTDPLPADRVVYDEDPPRAAELLARGGEYVAIPTPPDGGESPVAGRVPVKWLELRRRVLPNSPNARGAVLFLHERQTRVGVRGLVCVEADRASRKLSVTFIRPGAMLFEPIPITNVVVAPQPQEGLIILNTGGDPFAEKLPPADEGAPADARADLRIFAGQPDPKDATHFTIPYEHAGVRGEIDMWVFDEQTVHYVDRQFGRR